MDNVIVDFYSAILPIINNPLNQESKEAKKVIKKIKRNKFNEFDLDFDEASKELINYVRLTTTNNKNFWSNLPWKKNGKELWNFLKTKFFLENKIDLFILSAPVDKECEKGKIQWLLNNLNLPERIKYNFILNNVIFERKKYIYAFHDTILVDDSKENIKKFKENNGIGIIFKNSIDTIKKINEILN